MSFALCLLAFALALTTSGQIPDSLNPGAIGSWHYSLALQPDGKILMGGYFNTLVGQTRNGIGRLNADGTLDVSFDPGASHWVDAIAVQPDGKILLGGNFRFLAGQMRTCIGRLNADGTLDTTFNAGTSGYSASSYAVLSLALQADGKILVGGVFTGLVGQTRNRIGRLNADGTLDTTFNPGANSEVRSLALQADGKILVGGSFTTLAGQTRDRIARLNADGTLDTTFNPGANSRVYSLALQADGKILAGGEFTILCGQTRNRIGRLNADGTLDTTFNPGANDGVYSLALQADGKILVGGPFTTISGQTRNRIGRLNADGTLDTTFNPGANNVVYSLALQADGKILAGGTFTTISGQTRNCIARLNNTEPAIQELSYNGGKLLWQRGGTSPGVWRTTFEISSNGLTWTSLGNGTRVPGGWELAGLSLPAHCTIRARGYATGGDGNASSWFVERHLQVLPAPTNPPVIQANGTLGYGSNGFSLSVSGTTAGNVLIEGSSNLVNWSALVTNPLGANNLMFFSDKPSTNMPKRFYRARWVP